MAMEDSALMDLIEENLYLGELAAATNQQILKTNNITHILTIDIHPLPSEISDHFTCKFIEAEDHEDVDLLSHFEDCIAFIRESMAKGKILVHCYFGISRSATIVCAYLMQKYSLNFEDALRSLSEKRRVVWPNSGFAAQLRLFATLQWKIDDTKLLYHLFFLQTFAKKLDKGKNVDDFLKISSRISNETEINTSKNHYKCKYCRNILFYENDVFNHKVGQSIEWEDMIDSKDDDAPLCTSAIFVKPKVWMEKSYKGKITCPFCSHKLGNFTWAGSKCPCGARMNPMFYISRENVDFNVVV